MVRLLKAKLCSTRGETLVETLAAIMICTLSVTMLVMAITTAAGNNAKAERMADKLETQLNAASMYETYITESGSASEQFGALEITDIDSPLAQKLNLPFGKLAVKVYGGDDMASYLIVKGD